MDYPGIVFLATTSGASSVEFLPAMAGWISQNNTASAVARPDPIYLKTKQKDQQYLFIDIFFVKPNWEVYWTNIFLEK